MSFGFECGDGWFDLIWALSQKIEDASRASGLEPHSDEWLEAIQVKQKFGSLRFYLKNPYVAMAEEVAALIREAGAISAKTCEIYGNPGSRVGDRRVKTLCDIHAK